MVDDTTIVQKSKEEKEEREKQAREEEEAKKRERAVRKVAGERIVSQRAPLEEDAPDKYDFSKKSPIKKPEGEYAEITVEGYPIIAMVADKECNGSDPEISIIAYRSEVNDYIVRHYYDCADGNSIDHARHCSNLETAMKLIKEEAQEPVMIMARNLPKDVEKGVKAPIKK